MSENDVPPLEVQHPPESAEGVICPVCGKPFSCTQVLGRHKFLEHNSVRAVEKEQKKQEMIQSDRATDSVRLAYQLLDSVASSSGIAPELLSQLRNQDMRLNIAMGLVASEKCKRLMSLYVMLHELDNELMLRIGDMGELKKKTTNEICALQERVMRMLGDELSQLPNTGFNVNDEGLKKITKTEIFSLGGKEVARRHQESTFILPDSPQGREMLRLELAKYVPPELARRMGLPVLDPSERPKTIDAEAEVEKE